MNTDNEVFDEYLFSLSELYHENSKMRDIDVGLYSWITFVNSTKEIREIITKPNYKYNGFNKIELQPATAAANDDTKSFFYNVLTGRRSERSFADKSISFDCFSRMLYLANGITVSQTQSDGVTFKLRTTPSPGGLFPIELYCAVQNVEGVAPGVYLYSPVDNCIIELHKESRENLIKSLSRAMTPLADSISNTAVSFLLASNMPRVKFKYRERGYRFALLETGHIAQNISLAVESENLGSVCVGGYIDDELNKLINADGLDISVQYCILAGHKQSENSEKA
jgi:SagB-type dehydrogenase family enzyme